ncbi:MAG: PIN domain-containing protein [Bacteroidales bacterium]|nr:PIN domain-containing protein [Bacteroidales bacterium]
MNDIYLLDTNICIFLLKNKYGIREHIQKIGQEHCCISVITLVELYYGAAKSDRKDERMKDVELISKNFIVLPIDNAIETYGINKAYLESKGMSIDDFDLLIGSTATNYNLIMVTENIKHFERIPNIRIENWVVR